MLLPTEPKVYVTRQIPQSGLKLLEKGCQVRVNREDRGLSKDELLECIKEADALLCLLNDQIDEEILEHAPRLKVISNYAVGFNNIDIQAATRRGIPVCNTPDVLTDATADLAWTLLMSTARRVIEGDHLVRAGRFTGWAPELLLGSDISGKTIGIIGMGRIGQAVAKRAKGFAMNILYYSRSNHPEVDADLSARQVSLAELLQTSDFISIHAPLVSETYHLIGENEIALMKPSAILINTARGQLVDEPALVRALENKRIAGAGLDVFEEEPKLAAGLADLDNVVLLPHIGSATVETRDKMAAMAAQNIMDGLEGKKPRHCVNPQIYVT